MIVWNAGRGQKLLALFLFFAAASAFAGLLFGSVHIPADAVAQALLSSSDGKDDVAHQIVWQLRLPRVLAAFACGGLLALAGVLLQVLLRNPLADPYILGVSGGAAVGALLAMLLGWGLVLTNIASLNSVYHLCICTGMPDLETDHHTLFAIQFFSNLYHPSATINISGNRFFAIHMLACSYRSF